MNTTIETRLIRTSRFGQVEVEESRVFRFSEGLLGFGHLREYARLQGPASTPLEWLQSCEDPEVAFLIMNPLLFKDDYRVPVTGEELASLGLESPEAGEVRVILVVPPNPALMTANLQGPLVFNPVTRRARQLVLASPEFPLRFRVFAD